MRNYLFAAVAALILGLFGLGIDDAAAGKQCRQGYVFNPQINDCVWRAPAHKDFGVGTRNPKTIKVYVCISWFDRLNNNGGQRWWGLRLTSWPGSQYKPVYAPCRWQNVPVGYRVYNDPTCFPGWRYATDPITVAGGTYHLKRWKRL